jgi:hypothetical protein
MDRGKTVYPPPPSGSGGIIIIRVNGPGSRVDRVWNYFFIYTIKAFIFLQNNYKSSVYIEKKLVLKKPITLSDHM